MDLLSYQKGDILFSNCQTLVNPVSRDGTIDSYLSKRFFTRYPDMYAKYLYFCKEYAAYHPHSHKFTRELLRSY